MRARLCRALGWMLLALAMLGLAALAAALPAGSYALRFARPLTAAEADALARAAAEQQLDLALWYQTERTLTAPSGRAANAGLLAVSGSPALCCPLRCLAGTYPGAGQQDGCAVSAALADALFGSRDVTGLTLEVDGKARRITGVLDSAEAFVLCPLDDAAAGWTGASLARLPAGDPRGAVQTLLRSAGLPQSEVVLLPCGTLRGALLTLAALPLVAAGLAFLGRLWRALPLQGGARWAAGFGAAVAAALALPALLAALPRWLIPSRWSDGSFWAGLAATLHSTLRAFFTLSSAVPDRLLADTLLAAAGWLCAMAAGALLRAWAAAMPGRVLHFPLATGKHQTPPPTPRPQATPGSEPPAQDAGTPAAAPAAEAAP